MISAVQSRSLLISVAIPFCGDANYALCIIQNSVVSNLATSLPHLMLFKESHTDVQFLVESIELMELRRNSDGCK